MGERGTSSTEQPSTSSAAAAGVDMSDPAIAGMTADELKKFVETGRAGRRNAVPDVSQEAGAASASTVAEALGALSVKGKLKFANTWMADCQRALNPF